MSQKLNRRDFIKLLTAGTGGLVIVACTPETITVVETKEVIKEVTATAAPQVQAQVADVLGAFPRRETLIVRMLTGRVGTPDNMNLWVGWKNQDRGLQNREVRQGVKPLPAFRGGRLPARLERQRHHLLLALQPTMRFLPEL